MCLEGNRREEEDFPDAPEERTQVLGLKGSENAAQRVPGSERRHLHAHHPGSLRGLGERPPMHPRPSELCLKGLLLSVAWPTGRPLKWLRSLPWLLSLGFTGAKHTCAHDTHTPKINDLKTPGFISSIPRWMPEKEFLLLPLLAPRAGRRDWPAARATLSDQCSHAFSTSALKSFVASLGKPQALWLHDGNGVEETRPHA